MDWLLEQVLRNILNAALPTNTLEIVFCARIKKTGSVEDRRFGKRIKRHPKTNPLSGKGKDRALCSLAANASSWFLINLIKK